MKRDTQNGMKRVSVNLRLMFVIITNVEIKINADVNAKNKLTKECVIKDLFGILVIVDVNLIKRAMLVNIQTNENYKCRKQLVAPLIEKCTETVEEVKLAKVTHAENKNSYKYSSCTVYTVLFWIFFTINVGEQVLILFIFTGT